MSTAEATEQLGAHPEPIWDLIRDPAPETTLAGEGVAVERAEVSTRPAVGARFQGRTRSGWPRWSTRRTIVLRPPGLAMAWDAAFGPLAVARCGHRPDGEIEDGSTAIRGSREDRRASVPGALGPLDRGTREAPGLDRADRPLTLARVKARAEA